MGTSHARPHPDATRISKRDCATPGCGRTAVSESFCGVCRENFLEGNVVVFRGGELLPQLRHGAWDGDDFADLIPEDMSVVAIRNAWRAEKARAASA